MTDKPRNGGVDLRPLENNYALSVLSAADCSDGQPRIAFQVFSPEGEKHFFWPIPFCEEFAATLADKIAEAKSGLTIVKEGAIVLPHTHNPPRRNTNGRKRR